MLQFQPLSVEIVAPVLASNFGIVTPTAVELGVDAMRLRAFVRSKPELQAIVSECREQLVDRAENIVGRCLGSAKLQDQAAKFILTTIGSGRSLSKYSNIINMRTREPMEIRWLS
jgi:hypothetical protein